MKCVHLDFHTSPLIENIGRDFNREEYIRIIREAHIDLMTVFAKCHHGYTYYPSKVGSTHPNLKFNLLKEQNYSGLLTCEHEKMWHKELPDLPEAIRALAPFKKILD